MPENTPPPSTAAHKLYISLPEGVAPPPGFKTSSYDSDISKWIYQRVPTAWSCASEAAGNPRCGGWCYNESRCTASFVEVPGLDVIHDSDCALHNAPAFPVGPCNCSVSKPSTAASEPIIETLRRMADTAYCQMIEQAKRTECLGWEIKVQRRDFGKAEFEAHEKRCELYGRHLGLNAAIAELSRLSAGSDCPLTESELRMVGQRSGMMKAAQMLEDYESQHLALSGKRAPVFAGGIVKHLANEIRQEAQKILPDRHTPEPPERLSAGEGGPLAKRIFKADLDRSYADSALMEDLDKAGLPDGWTDFWVDEYDHSIEFGIVEEGFVMPQSALDYLWAQGFVCCWINYGEEKGSLYFHRSDEKGSPGGKSNSHGSKQPQPREIARLKAKLAEAGRDAARYRFLRCDVHSQDNPVVRELWAELQYKLCREERMDREVDAAMGMLASALAADPSNAAPPAKGER